MNVYEALAHFSKNRIPFALCTVVDSKGSSPAKPGAKMLVTASGEMVGTIGGAELELNVITAAKEMLASKSPPASKEFSLFYRKEGGLDLACGGTVTVFIEVIMPPPHVLVFGGGHVGLALSKTLDLLGYAYSVCDGRRDYRSRERFPNAVSLCEKPDGGFSQFDYAVVMTHGQDADYSALRLLHDSGFERTILLIGSKAKWNDFRKRLEQDGVSAKFLENVRCPAGLSIRAASVPEIALSFAGWIVEDHRR